MARSPSGGFALLLACALAGLGCTQDVGGRCVQDSDCTSGHCSINGVKVPAGHCESNTPTTLLDGSSSGGASGAGGSGGAGGAGGASGSGGSAGSGGASGSSGSGGGSGSGGAGGGSGSGGAGGSGGASGAGGSGASDAAVDSHVKSDGHAADARSDLGADR
jgi:hypothetical protein